MFSSLCELALVGCVGLCDDGLAIAREEAASARCLRCFRGEEVLSVGDFRADGGTLSVGCLWPARPPPRRALANDDMAAAVGTRSLLRVRSHRLANTLLTYCSLLQLTTQAARSRAARATDGSGSSTRFSLSGKNVGDDVFFSAFRDMRTSSFCSAKKNHQNTECPFPLLLKPTNGRVLPRADARGGALSVLVIG